MTENDEVKMEFEDSLCSIQFLYRGLIYNMAMSVRAIMPLACFGQPARRTHLHGGLYHHFVNPLCFVIPGFQLPIARLCCSASPVGDSLAFTTYHDHFREHLALC